MSKKTRLSPAIAAALATGAVAESELSADTSAETTEKNEVVEKKEEVTEAEKKPEAAAATPEKKEEVQTPAATATGDVALVAHLKDELKETRTTLAAVQAEMVTLKAKLADAEAVVPELSGVVRGCIEKLAVPLNASTADLATLSGAGLVARFKGLQSEFTAKFGVGGAKSTASADAVETPSNDGGNTHSPVRLAAVNSTRLK